MTSLLGIATWVLEESMDAHFGTSERITGNYIRNFMDVTLYHPYKGNVTQDEAAAKEIMKDVMTKATTRIGNKDTFGLFESPEQYILCYDALCIDIACDTHNLTEADYLQMID